MAKSKIPNAIERRHLIERDLSESAAMRYADAYLQVGRDQDAIEFLVKAEATDALEEMRARAIESGDVFLLRAISRATGVAVAREEWQAVARAASAAGKERFAVEANRQLDREDN